MALPNGDPGYPYERLTDKHTADIQRMRDEQTAKLRQQYNEQGIELYWTKRRLDRLLKFLREMGADEEVLIETSKVFE